MVKFRRKKFSRYGSTELNIPPANNKSPFYDYPAFPPDSGSFRHDRFIRSANTYSTYDYQFFWNKYSDSPDHYRKAILQGVDLFKKKSNKTYRWFIQGSESTVYQDALKGRKRNRQDLYQAATGPDLWDFLPFQYTFYDFFYEVSRIFSSLYYLIRGEQVNTALLTYYYFYYYFFYSEYVLEHLLLYFPILKVPFSFQLWILFDAPYYSFYELFLGFYLPFVVIFFFSQYYIFKNIFKYSAIALISITVFLYIFSLIPIYFFSGFSLLFIFFSATFFLAVIFVFYIFEISLYFSPVIPLHVSSYFLPAPEKSVLVCLPIFYYRYSKWIPVLCSARSKKPFTFFPFTQNVASLVEKKKRLTLFSKNYFKYKNSSPYFYPIPALPAVGLIFPKFSNLNAYSFPKHREHIKTYPYPDFSPYAESDELDINMFNELDEKSALLRDFMNFSDGYSQTSFLEVFANSTSTVSPAYLNTRYEEDFYNSVPSKKIFAHLYPYLYLRFWLFSIARVNYSADEVFKLINIPLLRPVACTQDTSPPLFIHPVAVALLGQYFRYLDRFFNLITFFKGYRFRNCLTTFHLSEELRDINEILINHSRLSYKFYLGLTRFIFRSFTYFSLTFEGRASTLTVPELFTYAAILSQFEEICLNLEIKRNYIEPRTNAYRCSELCSRLLRRKLNI